MAKVQIKSEKVTPFGGIFHVRELFSRYVGPVIDKVLGLRCTSYGYQYSEIVGSLSSVYFCGGDCVEDVTSHLMPHLSLHPTLRTCSSDTILRGISELATSNTSTTREIVEFYNLRGGKERIFDNMNNGFGWARLPKSFMAENTVFLLLTALIRNFYKFLMDRLDTKAFGLKKTSRIKTFVFKFISVPAKWIRTARHYELNIYTHNKSYQAPFALTGG
ncbi:MAG: transposase [Bacteroidaceae bacterium]|nr:transposase [Bacteroidaceae bacterium]